jgi:hypothetical protein
MKEGGAFHNLCYPVNYSREHRNLCTVQRHVQHGAVCTMVMTAQVAILTGFPCLLEHDPPTETDGPLGAFAIARALLALGKHVYVLTDECNAECVLACTAGSGLDGSRLHLEAFPPANEWTGKEDTRLLEVRQSNSTIFRHSCALANLQR